MEIVAEIGLAHDGSLGQAHAYIDACAKAGVDVVKFQCHLGDPVDKWRVLPDSGQDSDRQAYWRRTGFTFDQWGALKRHCDAASVEFLCSPFSARAVRLIDPLVKRWKLPSGRHDLAEKVKGKPVIASSGMFPTAKRPEWADIWLLCRSEYPTNPDRYGLDLTGYDGLSDHSGTIWPGVAAAALGARMVEVHVCWSKQQGGFDAISSVTVADLGRLVEGVRFLERAKQPVDKDRMDMDLEHMRRLFAVRN